MNINFHYYTVRALGQLAGFPPEEAQLIAEYPQFIDDYAPQHHPGNTQAASGDH